MHISVSRRSSRPAYPCLAIDPCLTTRSLTSGNAHLTRCASRRASWAAFTRAIAGRLPGAAICSESADASRDFVVGEHILLFLRQFSGIIDGSSNRIPSAATLAAITAVARGGAKSSMATVSAIARFAC